MGVTKGIECFGAGQVLKFSGTDYLGRVIGTIEVNRAAGSLTDSRLSEGSPWAMFFSDGTGEIFVPCKVVVVGQTINWTFGSQYANQGSNPGGYIIYGIK